jgi:hypothetical protein
LIGRWLGGVTQMTLRNIEFMERPDIDIQSVRGGWFDSVSD